MDLRNSVQISTPIMDYVDKYRLVIATPSSPTGAWSVADDEYMQNIVTWVIDQLGKENINDWGRYP